MTLNTSANQNVEGVGSTERGRQERRERRRQEESWHSSNNSTFCADPVFDFHQTAYIHNFPISEVNSRGYVIQLFVCNMTQNRRNQSVSIIAYLRIRTWCVVHPSLSSQGVDGYDSFCYRLFSLRHVLGSHRNWRFKEIGRKMSGAGLYLYI